jgi:hypothetical protein
LKLSWWREGSARRYVTMSTDTGALERHPFHPTERAMSKRARKRRSRKSNAANHGRKPNA